MIAHLKLQIEKMRREFFGTHSERTARLIEQMEYYIEDKTLTPSPSPKEGEGNKKLVLLPLPSWERGLGG